MIDAMRTLRNILFATIAAVIASAASAAPDPPPGLLVIRNGSDFATLRVTVYRLEGGKRSPVKIATVAPEASQMLSLRAGEYLATFDVGNATAAISEGRFALGAGEDYTINFQPKDKLRPTE